MTKKQSQFEIVFLEAETQTHSHSLPGPWGLGITSSIPSIPSEPSTLALGGGLPIKILPRPNERDVDPNTLKVSHH